MQMGKGGDWELFGAGCPCVFLGIDRDPWGCWEFVLFKIEIVDKQLLKCGVTGDIVVPDHLSDPFRFLSGRVVQEDQGSLSQTSTALHCCTYSRR